MEGPSLVILCEELKPFVGKIITAVGGNTKQEIQQFENQKIKSIRSWGKHLLIEFEDISIRIHFLMFGSYRINEQKENRIPRLYFIIDNEEINFYSCSVQLIQQRLTDVYDWSADVMSKEWDGLKALNKLKESPKRMICDGLMDQEIFGGVGNIIKNEVLFNVFIHPEAIVEDLSENTLIAIVNEAKAYSHQFYEWKKKFKLKKNWKIYRKRKCPRCEVPIEIKNTGKGARKSHFCLLCQQKETELAF